ncbi:MAG: EscU/YscU/HrcU family type III secretion system export apparatus switch protein [Alphaproteobacteria bacterium]
MDAVEEKAGGRRQVAVALRAGGIAGARVVASGRGALAEDILRLAFAAGIRVREDADLAATLAALELDADLPVEAMAAVAEVLARLYALNGAPPSEGRP